MIVRLISTPSAPRPDLMQTPLQHPDLVLDTDGAASRPSDSTHHAGSAVVTDGEVLEADPLSAGTSAHVADVYALIRARTGAEDTSAHIYTDWRSACGAAHDVRGSGTSSGKPLQHHQLITSLLDAILLLSQMSIIKCDAHPNGSDPVSLGSGLTLQPNKPPVPHFLWRVTAIQPPPPQLVPSFDDVAALQNRMIARK